VNLWNISLDFKSAPLEVRSKFSSKNPEFAKLISPHWKERIWLSTCNRVELYGVGEESPEEVIKRWKDESGLSEQEASLLNFHQQEQTLLHLFRVTASMESMVVGETQISGQVKRAYEEAGQKAWVGPILHRSFQKAFKVAKQVLGRTLWRIKIEKNMGCRKHG